MKDLEKIIRYLDGEMNGDEKHSFEKELVGDKALKQSRRLMEEIDRTIDDDQVFAFKEKLKETQELYNAITAANYVVGSETNEDSAKFFSNSRFNWRYMAAAAITLLIVVSTVVLNFSRSSNDRIFSSYYHRYEANYEASRVNSRGSGTNEVNKLIYAVQLYDKGDSKGAIAIFGEIIKADPSNTAAHFFAGISFIETQNYDKAVENLSYVISKNDLTYIEHADWYLALCYLKSNQMSRATSMLNNIANSNNYYRVKALDLLKKIH
jgi:tetratricopeptide (TPR) repeat protein